MIKLFDDDWIQKSFWNAERYIIRQEERAAARKEVQEATRKAFFDKQRVFAIKMLNNGTLTIEEIADFSGLSVDDVKELAEKK